MNDLNQNQYQTPENPQDNTVNSSLQNAASNNTAGQVGFYESTEYISPVYVTKKRGVNPLAIILPVTAVIIAAVIVFVLLMLNKPVSYREAEKNFFGSLFSAAEQTENSISQNLGAEKFTADFSMPFGDMLGMDFSQIRLEMDTASGETAAYSLIKAMLGETDLTAEMWLDRAGGANYLYFPEISEIYAMLDYTQSLEDSTDYNDYSEGLQAVFEKTADTYFEIVGDPETEKNSSFDVNGVTYTADKAVINLKISQVAAVCKAFLENMAKDPRTADMLCKIGEYDSLEEMRADLLDMTDELQKSIDGEYDATGAFNMTVYMKNNTVIGREIVVSDYETSSSMSAELFQIPTEKGENGYFHFNDFEGGQELSLSYNDETEGDFHSGNIAFDMTDVDYYNSIAASLKASYTDISFTEESFGGKMDITLNYSEQADVISIDNQNSFNVNIVFGKEGDRKTINITVPNICTINLTSEPSDLEFKSVPNPAPDKIAVISGDSESSEAAEQLMDDILNYFIPSYGTNDYPFFPEVTESEDRPLEEDKPIDMSVIAGDWSPIKMVVLGEVYSLDDEELGSYMKGITYSFTSDGVLTVRDSESDITEEYNCYFDSDERNHILLEDDLYSSIYYDESADTLLVSDTDGILSIWFERK